VLKTKFQEVKMDNESLFDSLSVTRKRLYEQIADSLQDLILTKKLRLGDQLPTERELATKLGVNRTTAHQALQALHERGLIEMKVGAGTYVTEVLPSVVVNSIERYFTLSNCSDEDLITLRGILEPETAALAAKRATPEDLARLKELVEQIEDASASDDIEAYTVADTAFHEGLAVASHNGLIIAIARALARLMARHVLADLESHRPGQNERARSHREMYEAIVAGDPDLAREAMRIHMTR